MAIDDPNMSKNSLVKPQTISPKTSALFHAEEGALHALSKSRSQNLDTRQALPADVDHFRIIKMPFDIRSSFRLVGILILASPLCLDCFAFRTCLAILVGSYIFPSIIRLRYPHFMEDNIIDDLRIQAGATLSLFASTTALLLETHHTSISIAVQSHTEFYSRPLIRLLRTYLFVEMVFNGTSEEKEQTASWLRWIHRHIHGHITDDMHKELGVPSDVKTYGYIDDLKAWVMYTLTYATIAFQMRYGRQLSKRAKDTIVLENTCAALRLGVPEELLARDYDSFVTMFNRQLDSMDSGYSITRKIVEEVEESALTANMGWITRTLFALGLMIGYDLLPERVRDQYQLKILSKWWQRAIQRIVIATLWFVYPALMWLPLRGVICLLLVLEPQTRPVFMSSLQAIHSMDIMSDMPMYSDKASSENIDRLAPYLQWLDAGKDGRPYLQVILVRILETQLRSTHAAGVSQWPLIGRITPWITLPGRLAWVTVDSLHRAIQETISCWRTQIKESTIFRGEEIKIPQHIGFVMDGNRRYARNLGKPVLYGHQHGAQTAGNILEWWLRFMPNSAMYTKQSPGPKYVTVWAFSSENLKRSQEEVDGLFRLMSAEFKSLAYTSIIHLFQIRIRVIGNSLAYTSIIHLFQIRIRVIGNVSGYPRELMESIELLEKSTAMYSRLYLQVAVGYGGRDEIVKSVKNLLAAGKDINEDNISQGTYCAKVGIPPVDLIVRTSERRTSGFFLWDTQAAEFYFIDKLWPQLTESDWLDAVSSFSTREMRGGK
ncbi:hypothetical protein CVT25_013448 [Psilocybe cyanescens]|uniref:ER-bound oxygenase mpaB/mpaB'/Rubber oxygenase catalytic domain-containing protein n=1 Tax=Psilocybe cyanescens TaxID=93625 RepID=A0A409WT72_PSICY|nr:hypothetical protein CVT25_013448 [Psilocybe cyanescens]